MEMPLPGTHHRRLEKLVGSWTGAERVHPSPWDPKGSNAVARVENRSALGGFVVVQDYLQEQDGQPSFEGHAIFYWDQSRGQYVMQWYDSLGLPPNDFRGHFEGDVLVLTGETGQGLNRASFDLSKPRQYHFLMEVSPDGGQWYPFLEGSYTRAP